MSKEDDFAFALKVYRILNDKELMRKVEMKITDEKLLGEVKVYPFAREIDTEKLKSFPKEISSILKQNYRRGYKIYESLDCTIVKCIYGSQFSIGDYKKYTQYIEHKHSHSDGECVACNRKVVNRNIPGFSLLCHKHLKIGRWSGKDRKRLWNEKYNNSKGFCSKCGCSINFNSCKISHIKSIDEGGLSNIENMRFLCNDCV